MHEGRRQTGRRPAHAGSRLKLIDVPGRSRLIRQPSSRTGENPPYGMIGGIEETSASFEARSAPRSHPTQNGLLALENTVLRKVYSSSVSGYLSRHRTPDQHPSHFPSSGFGQVIQQDCRAGGGGRHERKSPLRSRPQAITSASNCRVMTFLYTTKQKFISACFHFRIDLDQNVTDDGHVLGSFLVGSADVREYLTANFAR